MDFIVATRDFSGLGWAVKLQNEGHDVLMAFEPDPEMEPEKEEAYNLVGTGIIERQPMKKAFEHRSKFKDVYWVFDSNYLWEYADKLRKEGFKVFGASEWTSKMEFDREYGTSIAKDAGLDLPETQEFSDPQSAIAFLQEHPEQSYVCKPNDSDSHLTYVPQSEIAKDANRELRAYLLAAGEGQNFILQEKIKGVEVNVECFFFEGTSYFAWVELECKRKNSGDKGELTGCAQDIAFIVGMDSPIVDRTVAKMFEFYRKKRYTGFGDLNVIIADNKVYFIEFCCRFGYDAHANLFSSLNISPFGDIMSAMMDGKIKDFYQHFRKGFGAAIRMYLDHPRIGLPFYMAPELKSKFYPYELYQAEDGEYDDPESDFSLAGFGEDVGIITGFGYTPVDAAKDVLNNAFKIMFPTIGYREDLDEVNYPSSPIKRYEALVAMGLVD